MQQQLLLFIVLTTTMMMMGHPLLLLGGAVLVVTRIEGASASASTAAANTNTEFHPPITRRTRTKLAARRRRKYPLAITAAASTAASTDTVAATNNDADATTATTTVASGNKNEVAVVGHMHMDAYKKNSATSVALDIDNNAADTTTTTINPVDQVQAQKANQAQQWPRSIYRIAEKTNQEKVTGAMSLSRTAAVVTIPILQSDNREIIGPDKEEEEESSTTTTTAAYNYPVVQKLNARVRINHLAAMAEASTLMKLTRAGVEENNSMALDEEVTAMTNTLLYNSFSMVPVPPPSQMTQTSGSSSSTATGGYVPVANPTENDGPQKRPSISSSVLVSDSNNNNNNLLSDGGSGGEDTGNNSNNSSPDSTSTSTTGSDNSGAVSAVVEVSFDPNSFPDNNNSTTIVNGDNITTVEERLDNVDTSGTPPAAGEQPSSTNTNTTTGTEQTQTSSTPPTSSPLPIGITADLPEGNDDWVLSTTNNTNAQDEDGTSTATFLLLDSTSFRFLTTATMLGLTLFFIC